MQKKMIVGDERFDVLRTSNGYYIDKTELIYSLVEQAKHDFGSGIRIPVPQCVHQSIQARLVYRLGKMVNNGVLEYACNLPVGESFCETNGTAEQSSSRPEKPTVRIKWKRPAGKVLRKSRQTAVRV